MASISSVRDGLATRLATISGLRVHGTLPEKIEPPAAIVRPGEPFVVFDQTMGRGSDALVFTVTVAVQRVDETSAQDALDAYLEGSGSSSVKAAIEGDGSLGGVAHYSRVMMISSYGDLDIGGVKYLAADFTVEVSVSGT